MADYEEKQERKENAKNAALAAGAALAAVAWEIARSVIVQRGIDAANEALDKRQNKGKKE